MKILIATGGSPHAEKALRFGAQIIRCADETPVVLTVAQRQQDRPAAEAVLQRACALLSDVPCIDTRIRYGQPAQQIIAEAREGGYGLIIVGEGQKRSIKTRVLGSTALHVVEHAACPVITAKGEIRPTRRILLCDSGANVPSLLSRFIAQLTGTLLQEAEITVLHVMSQISAAPRVRGEDLHATAEELIQSQTPEGAILQQDMTYLELMDLTPQAKVRHGLVVDEIVDEARADNYDLVVIGAHRDEGLPRFLLDDLAHELVLDVERAILVVR